MTDARDVIITDVGPRDGLQNEPTVIPVVARVALIESLADAGIAEIEAGAFVSARAVPQLADSEEVFARIVRRPGTIYSALVPNMQGWERAVEARADRIALFTAASETFSQRNTNTSIAGTIERFEPVVEAAVSAGVGVRAYVSCIVACPYEGPVSPDAVRVVVDQLLALGPVEIDLGDTIGAATPDDIDCVLDVVEDVVPVEDVVLHLHDTSGQALACAGRGLDRGVRRFDASCAGLGGCPYAPGAPGNLDTAALLELCRSRGLETGVDGDVVSSAAQAIRAVLAGG